MQATGLSDKIPGSPSVAVQAEPQRRTRVDRQGHRPDLDLESWHSHDCGKSHVDADDTVRDPSPRLDLLQRFRLGYRQEEARFPLGGHGIGRWWEVQGRLAHCLLAEGGRRAGTAGPPGSRLRPAPTLGMATPDVAGQCLGVLAL